MTRENILKKTSEAIRTYLFPVVASAFMVASYSFSDAQRIENGKLLWPYDRKSPDFNEDKRVDLYDFDMLQEKFGAQKGDADYNEKFDIGGGRRGSDGRINFADFLEFAKWFAVSDNGKIEIEIVRPPAIYYNRQENNNNVSRSKPALEERK